jgi:hypothetical protein
MYNALVSRHKDPTHLINLNMHVIFACPVVSTLTKIACLFCNKVIQDFFSSSKV